MEKDVDWCVGLFEARKDEVRWNVYLSGGCSTGTRCGSFSGSTTSSGSREVSRISTSHWSPVSKACDSEPGETSGCMTQVESMSNVFKVDGNMHTENKECTALAENVVDWTEWWLFGKALVEGPPASNQDGLTSLKMGMVLPGQSPSGSLVLFIFVCLQ